MNYQGLEGKSAYALCRIYYRHLPFRCLDLSCLALISVGDGALAAAGGLVLHQPWRDCRKPSNLLFLRKMFDLAYVHFWRLISPQLFWRENVEPGLGFCCWPPSVQTEGSGELRPAKALGLSQELCPKCAFLKQLVQYLLKESYFGMPVFLSQGTSFPRSSSWCGCFCDQGPFESVSEYNKNVTWWP